MVHLCINPTLHHIPMKPHRSIFIYASCTNDNSLIHVHQYSMIRHVCIKPLTFDIIQSYVGINQSFILWHQSINHPLASINHLTSILWHQLIKHLASMTTWSNSIYLQHFSMHKNTTSYTKLRKLKCLDQYTQGQCGWWRGTWNHEGFG